MSQITILNRSNVPQGPFTREQVAQKLQANEFTLDSLAHVEGLSQWTPLRDVLAKVDALSPFVPPPPPFAPPPAPAAAYSYAATMQPPSHLVYAGFWIRFVAYFIDTLIITVVFSIVGFIICVIFLIVAGLLGVNFTQFLSSASILGSGQLTSNGAGPSAGAIALLVLMELSVYPVIIVTFWLYFAKLESGAAQATLGKRVLGLRVTDLTGQRISFGRATGRTFGKFVSALPMDIGFIMAGFTERKQALHDMIAGTLVVKN